MCYIPASLGHFVATFAGSLERDGLARFVAALGGDGTAWLVFFIIVVVGCLGIAWLSFPSVLPIPVALARGISLVYLAAFKRMRVVHVERLPEKGAVILVANHTTAYDPVCLQAACGQRLIRFMQAREYYEEKWLNGFYKYLQVIPVNRNGNDTASFRTALRALSDDGCIGIFPEGQISEDGALHEPHQGVALLAMLSHASVIPAYIQGTGRYCGMVKDFLRFEHVTLYFGEPIRLDDLADRHKDEQAREAALKRIMDGIVELRDRHGGDVAH